MNVWKHEEDRTSSGFTVPAIARFDGITIAIFYNDHEPPHVHVRYVDCDMSINIVTRERIEGWLPPRVHRKAREWVAMNKRMFASLE